MSFQIQITGHCNTEEEEAAVAETFEDLVRALRMVGGPANAGMTGTLSTTYPSNRRTVQDVQVTEQERT